jgi:hypothetical protein
MQLLYMASPRLELRMQQVVALHAHRMQIELSFRDLKPHRHRPQGQACILDAIPHFEDLLGVSR